MDQAVVIRPRFEPGRRIIAVSDVHGNLDFFRGLMDQVGLTPSDILVLVGDLLEKGPDSLALLRYVMELSRTHTVYPLCGNCDGLVLRFFDTDELDGRFYSAYLPIHPESTIRQLAEELGFSNWRDFPALRGCPAGGLSGDPRLAAGAAHHPGDGAPPLCPWRRPFPGAHGDAESLEVHEERQLSGAGPSL